MKTTKKLVSLLLAMVMVLALAVSASAATVTNSTNHSYDAYQIFSGTQETDNPAMGCLPVSTIMTMRRSMWSTAIPKQM